jgi:DNA polymerase III delta prime subunit
VLSGHLHDEVLLAGRIVTERWALTRVLTNQGGLEAVVFADAANGVHCPEPSARERVEAALRIVPLGYDPEGEPIPARLGAGTPIDLANAVRALLRQDQLAVAVVMYDLDVLIPATEQGRAATALLRLAVSEAECIPGKGPLAPRNLIIAMNVPSSALAEELAQLPGVQKLQASPPDRDVRAAALEQMTSGFYGEHKRSPTAKAGLQLIADRMVDCSIRELEQIRRLSHECRIPPGRPATLMAKRSGRAAFNPIARVTVKTIMQELERSVVGQTSALQKLRTMLERACSPSALRTYGSVSTKPLLTMLAFGPAGIGKTETARTLARVLFGSENALIRIDCGEYHSQHDVARLTGAPPGYVGYESGGQLTEPLRQGPAVVLFDEFDRAEDQSIVNLLLAVLDDGRLTDGRGETIAFDQTIVMFTTNLGADELEDEFPEGGELPPPDVFLKTADKIVRERIAGRRPRGMGRPEFLSRLGDNIVAYDQLRTGWRTQLLEKYCSNIAANLGDEFAMELTIDAAAFSEIFGRDPSPGRRDGRFFEGLARTFIELPLREQLESFPGKVGKVAPGSGGYAILMGNTSRRRAGK